jgi:indole-3-glycerol phosphate synthase
MAAKRAEMARLAAVADADALQAAAADRPVRDFAAALGAVPEGPAIIAEFKRRSPSVPSFPRGVDPAATARVYAANGAAALSVVTDEAHFGTSFADATAARDACDLPLLVKDFVVDPLQVLMARAAGADALLLIARSLAPDVLTELLARIDDAGMTALVECHDETDLAKALGAGAPVIGINSRDLETLEVDLDAPRRLLPALRGLAVAVAESGLRTRADVQEMGGFGADACLIGGALLRAEDPGARLRELGGRS